MKRLKKFNFCINLTSRHYDNWLNIKINCSWLTNTNIIINFEINKHKDHIKILEAGSDILLIFESIKLITDFEITEYLWPRY